MARTTTSPELSPDAHPQLQAPGAAHLFGIGAHRGLHGQGGIAGAQGVVFVGNGRAKQGHDAVAEHLVDRALEAVHGVHHAVDGRIEELLGGFGIEAADEFRRVLEVGKEHGDLLALAFEGGTGRDNFLGEVRGGVGPRPDVRWARPDRRRCGGWRRRCRHVAGPDQDVAILINGHLLGLDELDLEIVEGVIVQVELPFERAIGHAASTLEHGQGLVHNLLEGHRRPSTALALGPGSATFVKVGSLGKEHREYTRNMEPWQEKLHRSAGTVALGRSGRSRKSFRKKEMACRPRSPKRVTP